MHGFSEVLHSGTEIEHEGLRRFVVESLAALVEDMANLPPAELQESPISIVRTPSDTLWLEHRDPEQNAEYWFEIDKDGRLNGEALGVDDDGPFRFGIAGAKQRDYENVR